MLDLDVIDDPARAAVALDPVKRRILAELAEPASAAALAGAVQFFENGKPDNYKVVIPLTGNGLKR